MKTSILSLWAGLAVSLSPAFRLEKRCSGLPIHGDYTYVIQKNNTGRRIISGNFVDIETGEKLSNAVVRVRSHQVRTDTNGHFSIQAGTGFHQIVGLAYPYIAVTTDPIKVEEGETLLLKFRLIVDKRPTVD